MYSPESDLVTLVILKFPFDEIRNLPLLCRYAAPNRQRTTGLGSPVGLHIISTLECMRALWVSCGALLPRPKPAGIANLVERILFNNK